MNRNKTSLVLVEGATGVVVPQGVAALSAAGDRIRTLSLDSPESDIRPKAIETHETQIGYFHEMVEFSIFKKIP